MAADTEALRDGGWPVDQLPPGQNAQTGCETEALAVCGRSFFVQSENLTPGLGTLVTPVDEFSGIPLPLSPAYMEQRPSRYKPDDHHPWHDRLHPALQNLSGQALRASRVQQANYDTHHIDYHASGFRGPNIPTDERIRLRAIVLAAAGYIPDQAISFTSTGEPKLVGLHEDMRQRLWANGQIHVERPQKVREYLQSLVLSQDLSEVNSSTIDEFLGTGDQHRKRELGNELLGRAVRKVVEPIVTDYAEAYRLHLLPHARARTASRFVLSSVGLRRNRGRLYTQLEARLAS